MDRLFALPDVGLDPIGEARTELLREARQLLAEWEVDRAELVKGRLLQTLEDLRLLVSVEVVA